MQPPVLNPRLMPWTRLLLVALVVASLALFATSEQDATAALESSWLTATASLALLASAFVGGRFLLPASALLPLAIVALPAGPGRATAVALLAVLLVVAEGVRAGARDLRRWSDRFAVLGALALAIHGLLRAPALLEGAESWQKAALLPLAAGAALALLPELRQGLLAGAAVVVLAPGFNLVTVLTLACLAGGERLSRRGPDLLTFALLAVPFLREPRAALIALAAALALSSRPGTGIPVRTAFGTAFGPGARSAAATVLGLGSALVLPLRSWADVGPLAALFAVLMPLALPTLPNRRSGWALGLAMIAVTLGALRAVPGDPALVAPLALVVLLAAPSPERSVQSLWSGALLIATAMAVAYPWLRPNPLASGLQGFGLGADWDSMVLALLALTVASWLAGRTGHPLRWASLAIFLALATARGPSLEPITRGAPQVMTAATPELEIELPEGTRRLVLLSHLSNAAEMPTGTEVARLRLLAEDGRVSREWPLRSGLETNEWAARRPDLASLPQLHQPPPWSGWLVAPRDRDQTPFFGSLYRADFEVAPTPPQARLELRRATDLPAHVELRLYRIEVER